MNAIEQLTNAVIGSGIPISGIGGPYTAEGDTSVIDSWHQKGTDWFRVAWPSVPTAQQIADADAVIQGVDLTPTLEEKLVKIPKQQRLLAALTMAVARIAVNSPAALQGTPQWARDAIADAHTFIQAQG